MAHHPEYGWLEQHAAGTLPLPVALCVATHLSFCTDCRRQIELLQSVGGALFEQLAPVPVTDDLLQRVFSHIDNEPHIDSAVAAAARADHPGDHSLEVPAPLRGLIPEGYEPLRWASILPSLHAAALSTGDSSYQTTLHRIQPGRKVPHHDHRGLELTVVLRGAFSDEFGVYGPGDFIQREPGVRHHPVAALHEECLCLTVQEAPVRFTGLFWRLLNPLLR